jgi:hypothetical protein
MTAQRNGMMLKTIHAPWVNFVTETLPKTAAVKDAPKPLMARPERASFF